MAYIELMPRGIFHHHGSINHTCPVPDESGPPIVPLSIGITFHHLANILAGAMMCFACVVSFFLIMLHATHFSVPSQQKQIIRITFTVPVFSVISFLVVLFDSKSVYILPLLDLYESLALGAFFFLLCGYISNSNDERESILARDGKLGMCNRVWFFVFQQPVVMLLVLAVTEITEAANVYCLTSRKIQFAHVWMNSIKLISSTLAIISVIRFYRGTKHLTAKQKPLLKLLAFKLIIGLEVLQTTIFSFLSSSGHLHANDHLTFNDFSAAIPSLLVCGEMVMFSVFFLFAYPVGPYLDKNKPAMESLDGSTRIDVGYAGRYAGGPLGVSALLYAINIYDLGRGIIVAPAKLARGKAIKNTDDLSGDIPPVYNYKVYSSGG